VRVLELDTRWASRLGLCADEIGSWFESQQPGDEGRWGFAGWPAAELAHVIGTNIRGINLDGSQNPYRKYLGGFPGAEAPTD
jgi:hypothetical protein